MACSSFLSLKGTKKIMHKKMRPNKQGTKKLQEYRIEGPYFFLLKRRFNKLKNKALGWEFLFFLFIFFFVFSCFFVAYDFFFVMFLRRNW